MANLASEREGVRCSGTLLFSGAPILWSHEQCGLVIGVSGSPSCCSSWSWHTMYRVNCPMLRSSPSGVEAIGKLQSSLVRHAASCLSHFLAPCCMEVEISLGYYALGLSAVGGGAFRVLRLDYGMGRSRLCGTHCRMNWCRSRRWVLSTDREPSLHLPYP